MAYGKNKGLKTKKGKSKRQIDPFVRKVWYDIKQPQYLRAAESKRQGRTCVTKTTGQKIETEGLKGRVQEFNMSDLKKQEQDQHKNIKLEIHEIQGKSCLTDFHSMRLTRDKLCSLIKKKHTLVDFFQDCKTEDGYVVRLFVIGFTRQQKDQVKQLTYQQTAQIKRIRQKVVNLLQSEAQKGSMRDLITQINAQEKFESEIQKQVERIYPLSPCMIYKQKLVKKPKMDIIKLLEVHEKGSQDTGQQIDQDEPEEQTNLITASEEQQ